MATEVVLIDPTTGAQYAAGTITIDGAAIATQAKQDTGNTSLASILAKIIAAPATSAKQDALQTAIGSVSDAAWTSGDGSVISILKAIANHTAP